MGPIEVEIIKPLWTDYLIAIGTIGVAIIALFQDKLRALLQHPKLDICLNVAPPDCHKISVYGRLGEATVPFRADSYYLRFRVKNSGNQKAESVEVVASELLEELEGSFRRIENFPLINLLWTHIRTPYLEVISPNMEKICDFAHIIDPSLRDRFGETENDPSLKISSGEAILSFDFEVKKTGMVHLIPKGKYQLKLQIGAANRKPITRTLEIDLTGRWFDDEKKMLSEGIGLRIL